MMMTLQSYLRRGQHTLRTWALNPRVHGVLRMAAYAAAGFGLSAASLSHTPMSFALGFVAAGRGWPAVFAALGSCLGYRLFWGDAAQQCIAWVLVALPMVLLLADKPITRQTPLLLPALLSLITAAGGVVFQTVFLDNTPVVLYVLRVAIAGGSAMLFTRLTQGRNPILEWIGCAVAVLALAQLLPLPWLGLGFVAAGGIAAAGAFPAAALAGLALDLAQVTRVPMTAVLALGYLPRFLPRYPKWLQAVCPTAVYLLVMGLCNLWDTAPIPGLLLGSLLGLWLPLNGKASHRRGETGVAQVRLEMAAGVMAQTEQLLLESPELPVDEDALVSRAAERACGTCTYRKSCKDARRIAQLPPLILHKPLLSTEELPIVCRKSGRFLAELHRSQEQLRSIRADRERQREYRCAVMQQYRFMAEFLQDLSDRLSRRAETAQRYYTPAVTVYGNRPEADNGDRCLRFSGVGSKYYVLLCDGMGTGLGAIQEGRTAGNILKRLLTAGYPAEHALRSLNSLCALRDRAGAVTIDLAEVQLDTGKVTLYKWGAAPSYLVSGLGAEKVGSATPPPGLSVTDYRETVERVSLRRGEWLVMVSDGIGEQEALRCCRSAAGRTPEELAMEILACGQLGGEDDATIALLRLTTESV